MNINNMDNKIENSTIENFKLRPRTRGGFSTYNKANCINNTPGNFSNNTVWIEKKIKQEDSINKIALQYNVSVSDIKRFNNILNDQEIYALKSIRIPVSELKRDILLKKMSRENIDLSDNFENFDDEKARLINDDSEKEQSVEDIFVKTDTVVAQVRDALPDDEMHVGTYHFVDAKSPNSTNGIWMIILAVIIIFVIVPLLLTFIEEENHLEHSTGKDNDMLYHFKNN